MAKKRNQKRGNDQNGSAPSERKSHAGSARDIPTIPTWLPPVLYGVLALGLFREFVFSDRMLLGGDTLSLGYVVRQLYAESLSTLGRVPGWAPHILGGTPFLDALSAGDSLYPPSVLLLVILEPFRSLGWKLVLHVFLAGLFFFGWVRSFGGSRPAALIGGAAYMLAPFLIGFVHPGHDGKMFVIALTPLLFWATERHFAAPSIRSVSGIALVIALVLYTTHFQMAYFLFGGTGLYAIFRSIQIARGTDEVLSASEHAPAPPDGDEVPRGVAWGRAGATRFTLFMVAALLGATGASYQFFPAVSYVQEHSRRIATTSEAAGERGRDWSASYSLHPEEVMSFIVPEFPGNAARGNAWTNGTYWGRNPFKDNHEYAGLVVLLLAGLSFLGAARRQLRLFLTGFGVFALLYSMGANTPVWSVLYGIDFPGIRLFRSNGMASYLFGFSAVTMAALGVDRLLSASSEADESTLRRAQNVLWGAVGGLALLAMLVSSGVFTRLWTAVVYSAIPDVRQQILASHLPNITQGAFIAVMIAAATAGLVWAWRNGRAPTPLLVAGLAALIVVDEGRVAQPFIQTIDFHAWSQPDPATRTLLAEEQGGEPYRLWDMTRGSQEVKAAIHGIELAAGHHPNDLFRYRELIGMAGSGDAANLYNLNVRRILNVRYILWPDATRGPAPQGSVLARTQYSDGRVFNTILRDPGLPRARLVASAVVKNDAEAVPYILSDEHDPEIEAVLTEAPPTPLPGVRASGSVAWVERTPDRLEWTVQSETPALLVVADNWFPAWRATVDGVDAPVLRAYHTLRAVPVPAGTSSVVMSYESTLVGRAFVVSALVLTLLLAGFGAGLWRERMGRSGAGSE